MSFKHKNMFFIEKIVIKVKPYNLLFNQKKEEILHVLRIDIVYIIKHG